MATYMLLHAFSDPPNIFSDTSFFLEIKQYYAYSSIVFIYSALEYYIKVTGRTIYDHLNPKTDPKDLNGELKKDWLLLFMRWDKENEREANNKFNRVLCELPVHARKRLNNRNEILERDIEIYKSILKKFYKYSLFRHSIIHNSPVKGISLNEYKDIFGCIEKNGKLLCDLKIQPEKALDFYILCINLMEYFTYVCIPGADGNSRDNITSCFDIKELITESVVYEYETPQQLIDLLDKKLANYL